MSDIPDPDNVPGRDLIRNRKVGSGGGNAHENYGKRVTYFKAWKKRFLVNPPNYAITGVEFKIDGNTFQYGDMHWGPEDTQTSEISFADDEVVTDMQIWAWDWVDSIRITTNKQNWSFGGDGGASNKQAIGNGKLVGFELNAGYRLDSIGAIFETV